MIQGMTNKKKPELKAMAADQSTGAEWKPALARMQQMMQPISANSAPAPRAQTAAKATQALYPEFRWAEVVSARNMMRGTHARTPRTTDGVALGVLALGVASEEIIPLSIIVCTQQRLTSI